MTSLELPADRTAPARARRFVSQALRQWGHDDAAGDVALLVSELVTNAVLHARSAARLTVELDGLTLRVAVFDASSSRPRLRHYTPDAVTGRGLLLVDRIADRWGVTEADGGKEVWFELALTGAHGTESSEGARRR